MLAKKSPVIALLIIIAVIVFSTWAVVPSRAADNPTISAVKCDAPGKLTMWVWDENWQKVIARSIDDWKQKYCPGAEVDLQVYPWAQYWDLVQTNAAGDGLPDVFNMSQDRFLQYAKNGALLDLQPYWDKAKIKTDAWGKGLVDPYRYGDKQDLYAGPVNWDIVALYYNKDMFDAARVPYPTASWTWDDFARAAQALTDPSKDQYGALVYMEYQAGYANWIASNGVSPVVNAEHSRCTLMEPGSVEALRFLKDRLDKGQMPQVSVVGGSSADDAFNFWVSGKVAMVTGGSWKLPDALSKVKFNWDVARIPQSPTSKESRAILHAVGYVASARSKNPDLAGNLITYLVSDEGQAFFAAAGGVAPANPSPTLQQMWTDSFGKTNKNIKAFVEATQNSQGVTSFGEIWDTINTEIVVNIFDRGMSVEDATKTACDAISKKLSK